MVIDGERTYLTGEWLPDEDGTPAQKLIDAGIPELLFDHFDGRLEWHTPWHADRELSLLIRGRGRRRRGERGARRSRPSRPEVPRQRRDRPADGVDRGPAHAYHLVPGGASKAKAVAVHMRARGYDPHGLHRDRRLDRGPRGRPPRSAGSSSSPTGPTRDQALRDALARFPNATVTEGRWATASMKR